jgi:hypothetical protein
MNETAWIQLASSVSNLGTPAMLILVLIGGYRQWWVWGHQMQAVKDDRDFWRTAALRQTNLLERTVSKNT